MNKVAFFPVIHESFPSFGTSRFPIENGVSVCFFSNRMIDMVPAISGFILPIPYTRHGDSWGWEKALVG